MPKIVVVGANGQVGHELVRSLAPLGEVTPLTRADFDFLDAKALSEALIAAKPDLIVNAAADTAVDRAETEITAACKMNKIFPATLALVAAGLQARFVHYSTDYVFDGTGKRPYIESDPVSPVNAYGETKLGGEQLLANDPRNVVLRLSWVYANRGKNFALTMLRLANEGRPIRVVSDQHGTPSYAPDIADATAHIARQLLEDPTQPGGLFHLTPPGETTWQGFAQALLKAKLGAGAPAVEPITTDQFPTPAKRPHYSVLDSTKVKERFGVQLPAWEDAVSRWAKN